MKILGGLALSVLLISSSSAMAFNDFPGFGGMAKYYAKNSASAHTKVKSWDYRRDGDGDLELENSSEQYNHSFKETKRGTFTVGGASGSRNFVSSKWDDIGLIKHKSKTKASGRSGLSSFGPRFAN